MINLVGDFCSFTGCKKRSGYGYERTQMFCKEHKKPDMEDLTHAKCQNKSCDKRPCYNYIEKTKPIFCVKHKEKDMINVDCKKCKYLYCIKQPSYNYPEEKIALYCKDHSLKNMINVKIKKCKEKNCQTQPNYNFLGEKRGVYCNKHKLEGMVDVKHKTCQKKNCTSRPSYGIPGHSPSHCAKHKLDGHISYPKSKCKTEGCKNQALYSSICKKPARCEEHKLEEDINIVERECISCGLPEILNQNKECTYCDPKHFNAFRLGKQNQVKSSIDYMKISKYLISYDKALNYKDCGDKLRPDFVFRSKYDTHLVVLEVDENQHMGRLEECECTRMVNITQSNQKPTLFIRYNPDQYKVDDKIFDPTHNQRMKKLEEHLKFAIKLEFEELSKIGLCAIKQLYFNNKRKIEWETILEFEK